jgi:hypothetical protein
VLSIYKTILESYETIFDASSRSTPGRMRILIWKPYVILRTFQSLTLLKKKTPLKTYFKINE